MKENILDWQDPFTMPEIFKDATVVFERLRFSIEDDFNLLMLMTDGVSVSYVWNWKTTEWFWEMERILKSLNRIW